MVGHWVTKQVILATRNAELEDIYVFIRTCILSEMGRFTSPDTVENENDNTSRYPLKLLKSLSHESPLMSRMPRLKKGFIMVLLRNTDPKNSHLNGTWYIVENMTNKVLFMWISKTVRISAKLTLALITCGLRDSSSPVPGFRRRQFPIRVHFKIYTDKAWRRSSVEQLRTDLCKTAVVLIRLRGDLEKTHLLNTVKLSERKIWKMKTTLYP